MKEVRNIKHHCYKISNHKGADLPWKWDSSLGDLHWQQGWLDPDHCGRAWDCTGWSDGAGPPSSCSTPSPAIRGLWPLREGGGEEAAGQVHLALYAEAGCG